jgi:hypothetical protein
VRAAALHDQPVTLDRLQLGLAAARGNLGIQSLRVQPTGHHVVGEDLGEFRLVFGFEQGLHSAGRQSIERLVGWREHGERAGAFQGFHETRGLDRGNQCGVILGMDRVLDDVA